MATLNTIQVSKTSTADPSSMEYVDTDLVETVASESNEFETINNEFLDDGLFGNDDEIDPPETRIENAGRTPDPVIDQTIPIVSTVAETSVDVTYAVAQLAEVVTQPTTATEPVTLEEIQWDEESQKRKDETAFFAKLTELNVAIDNAECSLEESKEEVKLAKATHNLAVASLQHFVSKGVQYRKKPAPKPIQKPIDVPVVSAVTITLEANPDPRIPTDLVFMTESNPAWRAWETATILDGIEGLGAKKRDVLISHFPTFGKLMDARTEAGKEHVAFHSLLPKGIGESIGTELINRMDSKIVPGMWM